MWMGDARQTSSELYCFKAFAAKVGGLSIVASILILFERKGKKQNKSGHQSGQQDDQGEEKRRLVTGEIWVAQLGDWSQADGFFQIFPGFPGESETTKPGAGWGSRGLQL